MMGDNNTVLQRCKLMALQALQALQARDVATCGATVCDVIG
jgi:hypothetical protein